MSDIDIANNLKEVEERIAEAALRAQREPDAVTLVAVTKTFPATVIRDAYEAGARHFGENRVREGVGKINTLQPYLTDPKPTWHMIGHIQSRKAKLVVRHYDYVHSVDRLKIAHRLSRYAAEEGRQIPVLLECNISGEGTKYGFDLHGWEQDEEKRDLFFEAVEQILGLSGLSVEGLMTMPPFLDDPEDVRPFFISLRALRDALRERFSESNWAHLSMGMTNDFEVAVEEGSTFVRVGRGIFGPRHT